MKTKLIAVLWICAIACVGLSLAGDAVVSVTVPTKAVPQVIYQSDPDVTEPRLEITGQFPDYVVTLYNFGQRLTLRITHAPILSPVWRFSNNSSRTHTVNVKQADGTTRTEDIHPGLGLTPQEDDLDGDDIAVDFTLH
ncbi:MAG: hypothetical protein GY716_04765 [bacterium]|nr:hypothetical protein [bacterium]